MGGVVVVVGCSIEAERCGNVRGSISALGWPRKAVAITRRNAFLLLPLSGNLFRNCAHIS